MHHNNAHMKHAATDDHEDNEVHDNDIYEGETEVEG